MPFYSDQTISSNHLSVIEDKKTGTHFDIWNPSEMKLRQGYRVVYSNLSLSIAERIVYRLKTKLSHDLEREQT